MNFAREELRELAQDWAPVARIGLFLVGGALLSRAARSILRRATERIGRGGEEAEERRQRAATLMGFVLSLLDVSIWLTVLLSTLAELNVNLAPLLAAPGVLGAALAFGAQNVLKDYIAGFFILLENQFTLGDFVKIGAFAGTVEVISMRSTVLRGLDGSTQVIPNGTIVGVTNLTNAWARVLVEVPLPHDVDVDVAVDALREVAAAFAADAEWQAKLLGEPEVPGAVAIGETSVTVRLQVKARVLDQWAVKSELLLRVKRAFAERHIALARLPVAGPPAPARALGAA